MTPENSPPLLTHCFWRSNHSKLHCLHITNEKNHVRYSYLSPFIKSHNLIFLFRPYHNHVLTLSLVAGFFKYHHHHPGRPLKGTEYWLFLLCCICLNTEFCKVECCNSHTLTLVPFLCLFVKQTNFSQCCTLFYSSGRTRTLLCILDSALYKVR
jgi:hypothetical protein